MTFINRDPFARQEMHRCNTRHLGGLTCDWCGSKGKPMKFGDYRLFHYETQTDGGRSFVHDGVFCCKSCHDSYNS